MIGLLDYDWCVSTNTSVLVPNIEIMKLATYYKIEKNEFCRLLTLEDQELSSYDKIYFFSELNNNPQIPEAFLRANNVVYGGTSFTNGIYIPFENEIIDYTIPKPFIYKEFLKQKYNDGIKAKVIAHVLDDTYYRNYAGENKLPLPAVLPRKRFFLYDRDFFYKDWEKTITKISERQPSSIIRLHPTFCSTLTQYFKLREYPKFSRDNQIILNFEPSLDDLPYLFKNYKNLFLADINFSSNVYLPLGGSLKTNTQYFNDLIYKLNLLYSFWSKNIPLKIYFIEPKVGVNNPIKLLSQHIATWSNKRNKDISINDRLTKTKRDQKAQEELQFFFKFFPKEKNLFEQSFSEITKRGFWRI